MSDIDTIEQPVAELPKEEARTAPIPAETPPEPEQKPEPEKPHPLEPEGERFKQVWARAKTAEEKLQAEREERIRLEERLKVQEAAKEKERLSQAPIPWASFEAAIAEGRMDKAQAMEVWAQQREQRVEREALEKFDKKLQQTQRDTMLLGEINRYKQAVPEVMAPGTEARQKYEREYSYLTQTLGYQPGYATELAAVKMAFGDVEKVEKASRMASQQTRETSMETHAPGKPPQTKEKNPITALTEREKEHYTRMIKCGRYGDPATAWDRVKDEIEFYNKVKGH